MYLATRLQTFCGFYRMQLKHSAPRFRVYGLIFAPLGTLACLKLTPYFVI